jgi:hypothetical protein
LTAGARPERIGGVGLLPRLIGKRSPPKGAAPAEHTQPAPPAPDLRAYAESRGLDFRGTIMQPGFEAVMLGRDEHERNVVRGTLPGGEHGVLFHEWATFDLERAGYPTTLPDPEVRATLGDRLDALDSWIHFDPTGLVGRVKSRPPVRAAFTTAAVLVPEATAAVGRLRIDRSEVFSPYDFAHGGPLDSLGFPGWHARAEPQLDPELFHRFAGEDVGRMLAAWAADPYATHLVFWHGTLAVRRFGFEGDAERLDALASAAGALAARLRAAALAGRTTAPFSAALPPPPPRPRPGGFDPAPQWENAVRELAARLALEREDPYALHQAFPSLPVPGQAFAVLRGTLPGIAGVARLVLATGRPTEGWNLGRNAVLLPVGASAPATPVEGVVEREAQLRWHVAGDYAAFHAYRTGGAAEVGDVDGLIARAATLARVRGLVP